MGISDYGEEITFSYDGTYTNYSASAGGGTGGSYKGTFTYYTGTEWYTLKTDEEVTLTSNFYYYFGIDAMGESSSNAYNLLFFNDYYWLASQTISGYDGYCNFGCRSVVKYSYYRGFVATDVLIASDGTEHEDGLGVRPVVSLESDIKLTKEADGTYSIN